MLTLRPYQVDIIQKVLADWQVGYTDVLVTAATGSGKTAVFLSILNQVLTGEKRGMVLAHRKELIDQPLDRLYSYYPEWQGRAGIVMADVHEPSQQLIIATVQTLNTSKRRLDDVLSAGPINYLVTDEAHHAVADSYMSVYRRLRNFNSDMRHLGVTATPIRADGDGLGGIYQHESAHYGIKELIQQGYLVNIRWLAVEAAISLEGVKTVAGEFQRSSLGKVFETDELMRIVVSAYQQYAPERQAIAFSVTVAGAHRLAEAFRAAGVRAEAADGTTDKGLRAAILARFQRGETQVLCNVGLYTEGLDVPQASCILQARPTRSDSLYVQIIGRALRTFPGKDDALIIDFCPVEKRNVVMMGDVLGAPLPVRQLAEKQPQPGAVQLGFTFDGGFTWMDGSPLEIISRQLNYLDTSPWSWYRAQDGWMSIGLGMTGETERVLAITPPGETVKLVGVWRKPGGRWQAAMIQEGAMSDILERAEHLCNQYGDAALAARARAWRRDTATDKQIAFARRIGALRAGMSKGELAQSINHTLAMQAIGGMYAYHS